MESAMVCLFIMFILSWILFKDQIICSSFENLNTAGDRSKFKLLEIRYFSLVVKYDFNKFSS